MNNRRLSDNESNLQNDAPQDKYATIKRSVGSTIAPTSLLLQADAKFPIPFGRYELLRELGQGSMGEVYLARDTQLDRQVAIKIPKIESRNLEIIERFQREARAMATLRHPNLCPVYDVGEINETHYFAMAFIEGNTLAEYLTPGKPQPDRQVAILIRKLAVALDAAHRAGVIHRDLKPANIIIDNNNEPVITDFGLARLEDRDSGLTRDSIVMGTPAYMSPEQALADRQSIGPASDIYSLGAIMYEMLTGHLPCEEQDGLAWKYDPTAKVSPPSKLCEGVDATLEAICLQAMAKNIDDRFPSAGKLVDALREYLLSNSHSQSNGTQNIEPSVIASPPIIAELPAVGVTGSDLPQPFAVRKPRRTKRNKTPAWVLAAVPLSAAVLLFLFVLVVANQWSDNKSPESDRVVSTTKAKKASLSSKFDSQSKLKFSTDDELRQAINAFNIKKSKTSTVTNSDADFLASPPVSVEPSTLDERRPAGPPRPEDDDRPRRKSVDEIFFDFDLNDDDVISEDEMPGEHRSRLLRADTNDDKKVTRRELEAHHKRRPGPPPPR